MGLHAFADRFGVHTVSASCLSRFPTSRYATFGSATHLAICVSLLMVVSVLLGYLFAWWSFFPFIHRDRKIRRKDPDALQPERRLYWLLYSKLKIQPQA